MSSFKKLSLILTLFTAFLLAFAYWLEHAMLYMPCSLCLLQRAVFWLIFFLFLMGLIFSFNIRWQKTIILLGLLLTSLGLLLAARQIWIMHLPPEALPSCTAGLERLMQRMPIWEAVMQVIEAPGDCAEDTYTIFKIPMAYWSLSGFAVIFVFCLEWFWRKKKVD